MTFLDSLVTREPIIPSVLVNGYLTPKNRKYSRFVSLNAEEYADASRTYFCSELHRTITGFLISEILKVPAKLVRIDGESDLGTSEHDETVSSETLAKDIPFPETVTTPATKVSAAEKAANKRMKAVAETRRNRIVLERFLRSKWIERTSADIFAEAVTLGVVAISVNPFNESINLPMLRVNRLGLGRHYDVRVRRSPFAVNQEYAFFDLTDFSSKPVSDVRIFDIFDASPFPDTGKLTSVVGSLLSAEHEMAEHDRASAVASVNMARPPVLAERASGIGSANSAHRIGPTLAMQHGVEAELRMRSVEGEYDDDFARTFSDRQWEQWIERMRESSKEDPVALSFYKNFFPLPTDWRSARYQAASFRADLNEKRTNFEERVCAAYGVDRSHVLSPTRARFSVREDFVNIRMMHRVNWWRHKLALIYTDLMHATFPGSTRWKIEFPESHIMSFERIVEAYTFGLLTWDGVLEIVKSMHSLHDKSLERTQPSPEDLTARKGVLVDTSPAGEYGKTAFRATEGAAAASLSNSFKNAQSSVRKHKREELSRKPGN